MRLPWAKMAKRIVSFSLKSRNRVIRVQRPVSHKIGIFLWSGLEKGCCTVARSDFGVVQIVSLP